MMDSAMDHVELQVEVSTWPGHRHPLSFHVEMTCFTDGGLTRWGAGGLLMDARGAGWIHP